MIAQGLALFPWQPVYLPEHQAPGHSRPARLRAFSIEEIAPGHGADDGPLGPGGVGNCRQDLGERPRWTMTPILSTSSGKDAQASSAQDDLPGPQPFACKAGKPPGTPEPEGPPSRAGLKEYFAGNRGSTRV